jgi:hypothetical protein
MQASCTARSLGLGAPSTSDTGESFASFVAKITAAGTADSAMAAAALAVRLVKFSLIVQPTRTFSLTFERASSQRQQRPGHSVLGVVAYRT